MKTGTPPRIDGRSLDYSKMEEQEGDMASTVNSRIWTVLSPSPSDDGRPGVRQASLSYYLYESRRS
jgi:hypothetical protein